MENSSSETPFMDVKTTGFGAGATIGETPVPQLWPVPQFCH